jgi:hypothetical protein
MSAPSESVKEKGRESRPSLHISLELEPSRFVFIPKISRFSASYHEDSNTVGSGL